MEVGQFHKNLVKIETYLGSITRCSVKCVPHVKQSFRIGIYLGK
jgi:hypothetical protein